MDDPNIIVNISAIITAVAAIITAIAAIVTAIVTIFAVIAAVITALATTIAALAAIVISPLTAVAAIWAAKETRRSARAAEDAAKATSDNTEIQILITMLERYASIEMSRAIQEVKIWLDGQPATAEARYSQELTIPRNDGVRQLDASRRMVSHYSQNVLTLFTAHAITELQVRLLITGGQAQLYLDMEGIERAVGEQAGGYSSDSFDWVASLYKGLHRYLSLKS